MTDAEAIGADVAVRWRRLRESTGSSTPFAHEDVVRRIARAAGLRIEAVFCEHEGHQAGCLLYVRRRGPLAQIVVPPFCFYSAVILPENAPDETRGRLFGLLLEGVRDVSPDATVVLPPTMDIPDSAHPSPPWSRSEFRTFRAQVKPVADAIADWSAGSRRRYRKHANNFVAETDVEHVPALLEHVSDAYEKHGRGLPIARARLESLVRDLLAAGHAAVVAVRDPDKGDVVAGIVLILDETTAWDWIAGSIPGPGMTVCIGQAIDFLHERGVRTLDFGGANIPAIATFKRQFGGVEVTYDSFGTPTRPLVRWLSALKSRVAAGG